METVKIAFIMFALTLSFPSVSFLFNVDPFIVAIVTLIGLFITGMVCVPGTARLIVSIARKLEE